MATEAASPDASELAAWLHLLHTEGLGRGAARRLLARWGSPQAVLDAAPAAWRELIGTAAAAALQAAPPGHDERLRATRSWLAGDAARRVMVLGDADYPSLLLQAADPPLLLYLNGRSALLGAPSLAIVGSRHATPQGTDNARALARSLSEQGWTVVSGLAAGIDAAAHDGALEGPGSTVAVLGTGLDRIYPRGNLALARRVAAQGLLVSEMCLGTPPLAANFPQRNRLIAGLSRGTVVVEATLQSGSLITARLALEANREVFAVPGSIHSPQARGCHVLLRQGAKLVETAADVLEELGGAGLPPPQLAPPPGSAGSDQPPAAAAAARPDPVLSALGHDPATLDMLSARCGWPAHELNAHLLVLELDGKVARLPGGLFQRRQSS